MPSDSTTTPASVPNGLSALCARAIGTAVLAASLFVFMLATPPFAYGVWFQTEPVTVGLLAVAAASGLCLLGLDLTGHPVRPLLSRRHVQVLLAFLIWNALVSMVQDFPGRTWFGTPETGEGIFTFLALLILTLLAMALWPYRLSRQVLVGAVIVAALAIGGMEAVPPFGSPWRPEKYAAYAGTIGPPVVMIVAGSFRRPGWRSLILAVPVGLATVLFSGNKTAIALLCLIGPATFVAVHWLIGRLTLAQARRWLVWLPVVALAVTCFGIAAAMAYGDYDPLYSVRSRGLLIWAALLALRDHPWAWLTGFGWGSYNDILYQHNYLPGVHGFVNGVWDPNWEGVGAGAFHTHNDIFEAVLGGGAIGGLLFLLFFSAIIARARHGVLGVTAVGWFLTVASLCFWYPFMLCYPFLALAIAATTMPAGVPRTASPVPMSRWMRGAGAGFVGLLGAGCMMTFGDARAGGDRLAAINRQDPAEVPAFGAFPPDHGRGGVHLWWLALSEAAVLGGQRVAGHPPTQAEAQWYARLLREVDAWTDAGRAGVRLEALTLTLRNELVNGYEHTPLEGLLTRELPRWEPAMLRVIRHSPDRTDVAVPILAFLSAKQQYARVESICREIDAIHPHDRVCLWYTGLAMLSDPARVRAGTIAMHDALMRDVAAVAPVPDAARTLIEAHLPADAP